MKQNFKKHIFIGAGAVLCVVLLFVIVLTTGVFGQTSPIEINSTNGSATESGTTTGTKETKEHSEKVKTETENGKTPVNSELPYYISVNRAANCVTIYKAGSDGYYSLPYKAMICSTGRDTPAGVFSISDKYVWRLLVGDVFGQYASRICSDILFHSVPYYTQDKGDLETAEYNKLGTKASLGCIRLKVEDCKWIYDNCPPGTIVEIYDDEANPGPLGKPTISEIPLTAKWDPTDPDSRNPWSFHVKSLTISEENVTIERGSYFDEIKGVVATNSDNYSINESIQISGTVNVNKVGTYKLTYTVEDYYGGSISKTKTVKVVDTVGPQFVNVPSTLYWSNPATLTKDVLLNGVYAVDGKDVIKSGITVTHSDFVIGDNIVTYSVSDSAGNKTTYQAHVYIDNTAPVLTLSSNKNISDHSELSSESLATRISVSDDMSGVNMSSLSITATQTGGNLYTIAYQISDYCGNVATASETLTLIVPETEPATQTPEPATQTPEPAPTQAAAEPATQAPSEPVTEVPTETESSQNSSPEESESSNN